MARITAFKKVMTNIYTRSYLENLKPLRRCYMDVERFVTSKRLYIENFFQQDASNQYELQCRLTFLMFNVSQLLIQKKKRKNIGAKNRITCEIINAINEIINFGDYYTSNQVEDILEILILLADQFEEHNLDSDLEMHIKEQKGISVTKEEMYIFKKMQDQLRILRNMIYCFVSRLKKSSDDG